MAPFTSLRTNLQQHRGFTRSRVYEESRDFDSVRIDRGHRRCALYRPQRCEAEAQHHRVRPCYLKRSRELINSWCQKQILALRQLRIHRLRRIHFRACDIKPRNWDCLPRRFSGVPSNPNAIAVQLRNPHAELAGSIHL